METFEAIMNRRSIRKFTDVPIHEGRLERALRAAMNAPSAGTQLCWHFIVVVDRDVLKQIAADHKNAHMCDTAQAGVLFVADPTSERFGPFWQQDMGACVQNFLLAVHDMGLAACWTGIYPREQRVEDFRKMFDVPDEFIPMAFVPVGYPDEEKGPVDRFDEERVHIDKW
ncbi:MAG: nitroreductase family protein [Thermodesulfovibrionales bacterium]|nr:nitroreductase family protein [Thermodesulfovibrionales bacterium]